jgi:hypothetical protein
MPFVSRRLDPSTSRPQPDANARPPSGLHTARRRARRAAAAAFRLGDAGSSTSADATLAKTGEGNATQKPLNKFLPKVARSFYICSCAVPEETAEPIVDLLNRGVSVVGIAAREDLTAGHRKGLKRLNPRPDMVWSRKTRTHKMWYTGVRLAARDSG